MGQFKYSHYQPLVFVCVYFIFILDTVKQMRARAYAHTQIHSYTRTHARMCAHILSHTIMRTCTHVLSQTHTTCKFIIRPKKIVHILSCSLQDEKMQLFRTYGWLIVVCIHNVIFTTHETRFYFIPYL